MRVLHFLLFLTLAAASAAQQAPNAILNGDFETGTAQFWTPPPGASAPTFSVVPEDLDGDNVASNALRISGGALQQVVWLEGAIGAFGVHDRYRLSVAVRGSARIRVESLTGYEHVSYVTNSSHVDDRFHTWQTFDLTPGPDYAILELRALSDAAIFDDVSLRKLDPREPGISSGAAQRGDEFSVSFRLDTGVQTGFPHLVPDTSVVALLGSPAPALVPLFEPIGSGTLFLAAPLVLGSTEWGNDWVEVEFQGTYASSVPDPPGDWYWQPIALNALTGRFVLPNDVVSFHRNGGSP